MSILVANILAMHARVGREMRAVAERDAAMKNPAFRAGYEAYASWGQTPTRAAPPRPPNPYAEGSTDADAWALGFEQAELEEGSPDSWHDGGAGMRGVLRLL